MAGVIGNPTESHGEHNTTNEQPNIKSHDGRIQLIGMMPPKKKPGNALL